MARRLLGRSGTIADPLNRLAGAIGRGREAHVPLEELVEARKVAEAHHERYVRHRHTSVLKQALRALDARAEHIAAERHAYRLLETVREMVLAHSELAGEGREREIIRGAKLDRLHQLLDREIQDVRRGAGRQEGPTRGAPVAVRARSQNFA